MVTVFAIFASGISIGCVGIEVLRTSEAFNEVRQYRERNIARKIAIPDEVNVVRTQHHRAAVVLNAVAGNYSFTDRRQFLD